jgi:hypothetical protein
MRQTVLTLDATAGDGVASATGEGASQHAELAQLEWVSGTFWEDMAKPI